MRERGKERKDERRQVWRAQWGDRNARELARTISIVLDTPTLKYTWIKEEVEGFLILSGFGLGPIRFLSIRVGSCHSVEVKKGR